MKKLLTIATAAGMLAFIACGPSAEDKAKADKQRADSAHQADSLTAVKAAASLKAKADSVARAHAGDSIKKDSAAH